MFEIDAKNLPIVRTRQALLAIDIQNDIVSADSLLRVDQPRNFLQNIIDLVPHFRKSDPVIWVRSTFESSRPVNEYHAESEKVITDRELSPKRRTKAERESLRRGQSRSSSLTLSQGPEGSGRVLEEHGNLLVDEEEYVDPISETFLTVEPGDTPQIVLQSSAGANIADVVLRSIYDKEDLDFYKSHYSAFKDGRLVQTLRSRFVTDLYICGALTNISIYATAVDAARHGYSITVISDCLGYRNKDRHDEALHQMIQFTGCDVVTSQELIRSLQEKERAILAPPPPNRNSRPRSRPKDSSLENLISSLNLKTTAATGGKPSDAVDPSRKPEPLKPDNENTSRDTQRDHAKTRMKVRRRTPETTFKEGEASSCTVARNQPVIEPSTKTALPETGASGYQILAADPNIGSSGNRTGTSAIMTTTARREEPQVNSTSDILCEGDTTIIENLLPDAGDIFEKVRDEVRWQKMSHQGGDVPRLVCVQGEVAEDGSLPIYRHPADESPPLLPFTTYVSKIRDEVEKRLGHAVNHVLIQFYRGGTDHITEHSDKTLDIMPDTYIANVSLGAQRTMAFRTKTSAKAKGDTEGVVAPRKSIRAPLTHNSMCKMGLVTNMRWLHGIRPDKRPDKEKSKTELAYNGGRISLTFRLIGTFLDMNQQIIWGQGATSKLRDTAHTVINGKTPEAEAMIKAFGVENRSTELTWKDVYGSGFDVLHISNSPKLFLSGDLVEDQRVKLLLAELGIDWTEGQLSSSFYWKDGTFHEDAPAIPEKLPVKFVDNDLSNSTVVGDIAILYYLDSVYLAPRNSPRPQIEIARMYTRVQQSITFLGKWRADPFNAKALYQEAESWDAYLTETPFLAGNTISVADFAVVPIIENIARNRGPTSTPRWTHLIKYFYRMREEPAFQKGPFPSQTPLLWLLSESGEP
ncbi:hypothetical protein BJ878DRAFT_247342 [Calycina marina]|uniref:Fe2OG dioxygenase domain-containing protein n=1 Tax=Calycina marina TaxID=1763456 RepID=A0A9P7Z865_9HELO|nr:hypothetical protein BJ878DRAFT_247342 [Calycina marina]